MIFKNYALGRMRWYGVIWSGVVLEALKMRRILIEGAPHRTSPTLSFAEMKMEFEIEITLANVPIEYAHRVSAFSFYSPTALRTESLTFRYICFGHI